MRTYRDLRVTIVGCGREGVALCRVLVAEGAHVTVTDTRDSSNFTDVQQEFQNSDTRFLFGDASFDALLACDTLFLSPGVSKESPLVTEATRRNIDISSETALFFDRCLAPIIGVTGSAGKTTTTTLIGDMLRHNGRTTYVGGNIGSPLIGQVASIQRVDNVILELSSFQLECLQASPHVAVITNLTPNHLDRHGSMEAYAAAKAHIVSHQTVDDITVVNADDPGACSIGSASRGRLLYFSLGHPQNEQQTPFDFRAYLDGETLMLHIDGVRTPICTTADLQVPGAHNRGNVLAAAAVASLHDVSLEAIRGVATSFKGVAHRLQRIRTLDDVAYYDDSIATAPERTTAALAAISTPIILILGGRDKKLPWSELADTVQNRCRGVVTIGEAAPLIEEHLRKAVPTLSSLLHPEQIVRVSTMREAVEEARRLSQAGDSILLSPACTSYDMYDDFASRGDDFNSLVQGLQSRG